MKIIQILNYKNHASFYCYLNYKTEDFVIDLDDIWKWLGYTQKVKGKELLEKNFKLDIDYQLVFSDQVKNSKGGRPKEKFMMNVKTFKKMCLKAHTAKSNEIHNYYIKLEEILQDVLLEQTDELRLQLEQKNTILEQKENLLELHEDEILKQSKRIKLLEIKSSKKMARTDQGKNVVYVVTNGYIEKDRTFVIGKSISLANRLSQYNKNAEHKVVYHRECNNAKQMSLIEEIILYKLDKYLKMKSFNLSLKLFELVNQNDVSFVLLIMVLLLFLELCYNF